jgi:hypothetical protein
MTKNNYYIFIEDQNKKNIINLIKNNNWNIYPIVGGISNDTVLLNENDNIYDILKYFRTIFDYVEEISYNDIDDYID